MLYSSILNMEFDDFKDEPDVYTDKARRVCTLPAEEADGFGEGHITAFFDLINGSLITINERVEVVEVDTMMKVEDAVNNFNESQHTYVAVYHLSDDANYIDINVTTKKFSDIIEDAIGQ